MCDERDPYGCEFDEEMYSGDCCCECDAAIEEEDSGYECEDCGCSMCERCMRQTTKIHGCALCEECDRKQIAEGDYGEIPVLQPIAQRPTTFVSPKDDNDMILEGREDEQ